VCVDGSFYNLLASKWSYFHSTNVNVTKHEFRH